jgi:hypothetical protein
LWPHAAQGLDGGVGVVVQESGQDPVPAGGLRPGLVGDSHGELDQPGDDVVQPGQWALKLRELLGGKKRDLAMFGYVPEE